MTAIIPEGWIILPTQAFGAHVGPFYQPAAEGTLLCGFVAEERHGNKRGVAHGGMLATAFDVALGEACWAAAEGRPSATVQLGVQYIGALQLGEFATVQAEITRATRSLIFARGVMAAGGRTVATAEGIWKILAQRGAPSGPPGG